MDKNSKERSCLMQDMPCSQYDRLTPECQHCPEEPTKCAFVDIRSSTEPTEPLQSLKSRTSSIGEDETVFSTAVGFSRLKNQHPCNSSEKLGTAEGVMTTAEAKMVVSHLIRPVCEMLQKDADFLRNHMTDEDSNGEVIARLESRGCSDSCDSCDLEIFNGHFFCTACGRTECPRCGLSKSKCSRTGTKGRHRKEVAVVHSDIQDSEDYIEAAKAVAKKHNIAEFDNRPPLGCRTWPRLSEDGLRDRFPHCNIKVADQRLVLMTENECNVEIFEYLLREGFPFVVECNLDDRSTQFWEATRLGQLFGDTVAEVKNINTNEKEKDFPLKDYFNSLDCKDFPTPRKISDYPEEAPFLRFTAPEVVKKTYEDMPFKRHVLKTGPLNMVSAFHWADVPDCGPKIFSGHGSCNYTDPTALHTDLVDAANLCVFALPMLDSEREKVREMAGYDFERTTRTGPRQPAALWHLFHRSVYTDIVSYLQKQRKLSGDPIQDRTCYLFPNDLSELRRKRKVEAMPILQGVGDVVVIPGCLPHQVLNVTNTTKVAVDFVSPFNSSEMALNLDRIKPVKTREDYIGVFRTLHKGLSRAIGVLHAADGQRQDLEAATRALEKIEMENGQLKREKKESLQRQCQLEKENECLQTKGVRSRAEIEDLTHRLKALESANAKLLRGRPQGASTGVRATATTTESKGYRTSTATATASSTATASLTASASADSAHPSSTATASTSQVYVPPDSDRSQPLFTPYTQNSEDDFEPQSNQIKRKRPGPNSVKCPNCKKTFPNQKEMEDHTIERHRVTCEICNRHFSRNFTLHRHMRTAHSFLLPKEVIDYINLDD